MHPGPATNHCRRAALLAVALASACASPPARYQPGPLSTAQLQQVRAAETAYRATAADYVVRRDKVLADPLATAWLVRMFVRDVFTVREGRPLADRPVALFRAAGGIEDPVETRALAEIRHIGAKAVPILVGDLLMDEQPLNRELGIELLGLVGAPAVPELKALIERGEQRQRRAAARALGRIGLDAEVLAILREMAEDGDYTVRADAVRSMVGGGPEAQDLLQVKLREDSDPFVQRTAAQALAEFPNRKAAGALVDYLEHCLRADDRMGERTAQSCLQRMAGTRTRRLPEAWREFAKTMADATPPEAIPAARRSEPNER